MNDSLLHPADGHSTIAVPSTINQDVGRGWVATGAILAGLAVALGAFAAHGLDRVITDKYAGQTRLQAGIEVPASVKYLGDFKTAAEYQMTHALGLILIGVCLSRNTGKALTAAAWLLLLGTVVFSGSLYLLVLTGARWLGAITPIGGTALILGWATFACGFTGPTATRR